MTRINKILLPLCCLLLVFFMLALSGCKKAFNCYVNGSYECVIKNNASPFPDTVNSSFKIRVPDYGEYTLTFEIEAKIETKTTGAMKTETVSHSCTVYAHEETEHIISVVSTFSKISTSDTVISARVINVKLNSDSENSDNGKKDYSYAIGFGTAGGVVLIGLIVVFVLDKTGVLYKKNNLK